MRAHVLLALGLVTALATFAKPSLAEDTNAQATKAIDHAFSGSPATAALGFSLGLTTVDAVEPDVEIGLFFRGALLTTNRGISKDMLARQPVWVEKIAPRCLPFRIPLISATF